ncbi:hypothetical protein D3C78_1023170 [compost metagenome]
MNSPVKSFWMLLLLLCIHAQTGCASTKLDNLTYEEAVEIYRAASHFENYRCIHLAADDNYQPIKAAKPIAIEIDEVLYLKIDGRVHELTRTTVSETEASYVNSTDKLEAGYSIVRRFNYSEYGESDDRHVNLWVKTPDKKKAFKTFGDRCGL